MHDEKKANMSFVWQPLILMSNWKWNGSATVDFRALELTETSLLYDYLDDLNIVQVVASRHNIPSCRSMISIIFSKLRHAITFLFLIWSVLLGSMKFVSIPLSRKTVFTICNSTADLDDLNSFRTFQIKLLFIFQKSLAKQMRS